MPGENARDPLRNARVALRGQNAKGFVDFFAGDEFPAVQMRFKPLLPGVHDQPVALAIGRRLPKMFRQGRAFATSLVIGGLGP